MVQARKGHEGRERLNGMESKVSARTRSPQYDVANVNIERGDCLRISGMIGRKKHKEGHGRRSDEQNGQRSKRKMNQLLWAFKKQTIYFILHYDKWRPKDETRSQRKGNSAREKDRCVRSIETSNKKQSDGVRGIRLTLQDFTGGVCWVSSALRSNARTYKAEPTERISALMLREEEGILLDACHSLPTCGMANQTVISGPTLVGNDLEWTIHTCPSTLRREFRDVFVGTVTLFFLSLSIFLYPPRKEYHIQIKKIFSRWLLFRSL